MTELAASVFYGPGDWLAGRLSARDRRAIATWVWIFWLGPGFVIWLFLLHSLWFVGLMSIVAIWLSCWAMVGAETPVEEEAR